MAINKDKYIRVQLGENKRTVNRKLTQSKKDSESNVVELFLAALGLDHKIEPILDESAGQPDLNIHISKNQTLTVETTEFVLQQDRLRSAICNQVLEKIDEELLANIAAPKTKCFLHFNFIDNFKRKEIEIAKIVTDLHEFFKSDYNEKKVQTIYKDAKLTIQYHPTGFLTKTIKRDYPGDKKWQMVWFQNPYSVKDIEKQIIHIVDDNKGKEDHTDILLVYVHVDNMQNYAFGFEELFQQILSTLKFKGIYLMEIIEKTIEYPAGKKSSGIEKSTLSGDAFTIRIETMREHPSLEIKNN